MIEHDHGRTTAHLAFLSVERAAVKRLDPEHVEVVAAHHLDPCSLRLASVLETHRGRQVQGEVLQDVGALAVVEIIRIRDADGELDQVGIAGNDHELLRIGNRQRPEQEGVHDREDRRVYADAEPQRQDGNQRETLRFGQAADGVTEVVHPNVHELLHRRSHLRCVEFV